ncbi:MAG: type II secretion system GspH family protein [Lachnospiraceae bacterium]|nr:type II secretion system GspH family protein [Lachnospiraceae bacterium]
MKNNKGFSLVELIIVIAIMAILVGVMAPQLIKYIEKSNVSADTQLAGTVQTAATTAMMDPEVLANQTASNYITTLQGSSAAPLTSFVGTANSYTSAVSEILGVTSAAEVTGSLKSAGASSIEVTLGTNSCAVVLPGTDSRGSKSGSGYTYAIGVY